MYFKQFGTLRFLPTVCELTYLNYEKLSAFLRIGGAELTLFLDKTWEKTSGGLQQILQLKTASQICIPQACD